MCEGRGQKLLNTCDLWALRVGLHEKPSRYCDKYTHMNLGVLWKNVVI